MPTWQAEVIGTKDEGYEDMYAPNSSSTHEYICNSPVNLNKQQQQQHKQGDNSKGEQE